MAFLTHIRLRKYIKQHTRWLLLIALGITGIVVLIAMYDLALRMFYELRGPFTWDTPIYWAVGRGILNGLIPYHDLFETKPPGIFLLSAASFRLFGSPILGHLIEALGIPLYPFLLGWQTWKISMERKLSRNICLFCVLIASLTGILIGLYTMERSGEFQVESFGALFSLLFFFVIADERRMSALRMLLASLLLLCAVGMKEPFILTILGGAMILCSDKPKRLLRAFVVPFSLAVTIGGALMLVLGYWRSYFTIYLPELLGKQILDRGLMWSNLSAWQIIFRDLQGYVPGFGLLIGAAIVTFLLRPLPKGKRLLIVLSRFFSIIVAIYLGVIAVAMKGDFYNHQFVFAVPIYLALMMVINRDMLRWKTASVPFRIFLAFVVGLLVWANIFQTRYDYESRLRSLQENAMVAQNVARQIDAVLVACDEQRYLFLGGNGPQPYGYTQHSPLGPIFFQFNHFLEPSRPYFRETFLHNLSSARLIIRNGEELSDLQPIVDQYITAHFSSQPWSCASALTARKYSGYEFLYRRTP